MGDLKQHAICKIVENRTEDDNKKLYERDM